MNTAVKTAAADPKVHDLISTRWSPRAFSDQNISIEDLKSILDAGRWAASSYNEQPWRFIVGAKRDDATYNKILSVLMPLNQDWAKFAPVLILTIGKKDFSHNREPNRYALHDAGAALANMFLQANALGLHGHGMGGFDHERARSEFNIPADYEIGAVAAFGYLGSPETLSERFQKQELAPRQRKPLSELVFTTSLDTPFQF